MDIIRAKCCLNVLDYGLALVSVKFAREHFSEKES